MGLTKISWTHYTFNPWWGCSRISPGCVNCYADSTASRWGHNDLWRRAGPRRKLSDRHWGTPLKWERDAAAGDPRRLVFCASMADVFERHPNPEIAAMQAGERARLWALIQRTPHLTWQLLTKRIENVPELVPWGDDWPTNVWLGVSVEDQRRADERLPQINAIRARVLFASVEPMLERVDLTPWLAQPGRPGLHAALVGGESDAKARPFDLDWARDLRDQVARSDTKFFFKQLGTQTARQLGVRGKGENLADIPADLRIRELPSAA